LKVPQPPGFNLARRHVRLEIPFPGAKISTLQFLLKSVRISVETEQGWQWRGRFFPVHACQRDFLAGISVGDVRLSMEMPAYVRPLSAQAERHIRRHHYVKTHSPHIQEVDKGACGAYNKQRKAMNGKVSAYRS
jgi:hypothetical protein